MKYRTTLVQKPVALILSLISLALSTNVIIDNHNPDSDQQTHVEVVSQPDYSVNPRFGNNSEEAQHIILWETQCLAHALGDVLDDNKEDGGQLQKPEEVKDKGDLFEQLERWALQYFEMFKNTDFRPFMESIQMHEPLGVTDYNMAPFLGIMIAFVVFLMINMIIFCLFTFVKKLRVKVCQKRECCLKVCLAFVAVLVIISFALLITNYVWLGKMYKIEEKLLCEATRIPHTLFFGNPELHFEVAKSSHFIGLERVRKFITSFLNDSVSFTQGSNLKLLQEIETANLKATVDDLENAFNEFFAKYKDMKGRDSSGRNRVPVSISHTLPFYQSHMDSLLKRFQFAATHLHQISDFSHVMKDTQRNETFIRNIREAHESLVNLQVDFSKFWNDVMHTSFDSTLGFKISVIGLAVMVSLIVISLCGNLFAFGRSVKQGKMKDKMNVRCLMILVVFISFWGFMALFEVGRGTFSTVYGCSVMFQMDADPYNTRDKIIPYIANNQSVRDVFEHCYFKLEQDSAENFYKLFRSTPNQMAVSDYLSFLDGLKLVDEGVKYMEKDKDVYYTHQVIEALKTFQTGKSLDYDDVFNNLSVLNYNFDCSDIYYALTDTECANIPAGKHTCIRIDTGHYQKHACMEDVSGRSAVLFDNLKEYITREKDFIHQILLDMNGAGNDEALLSKIHHTIEKYEMVDQKVRWLNSDLKTNFSSMTKGSVGDWLNCGVIRDEVKKTFNSLCNHDLEVMMKFGDLNFMIIFLALVIINMLFVLSCCFPEAIKKVNRSSTEELNNTFEGQNVFQENEDSSPIQYKDDDGPPTPDNEMKPFGDFGTFKNPEPKSSGPVKGDRVAGGGEFEKMDEKDDFDDPFNQFGTNEYDFKK